MCIREYENMLKNEIRKIVFLISGVLEEGVNELDNEATTKAKFFYHSCMDLRKSYSGLFSVYFQSFRSNIVLLYNKLMWKMGQHWPLFHLFSVFLIKHVQQNNLKNVHPVSGPRIRTHNLLIMSFLP